MILIYTELALNNVLISDNCLFLIINEEQKLQHYVAFIIHILTWVKLSHSILLI